MAEAMDTDMPVAEGTRLVIKEMVLENFKSYAGEQRVGPFHKVPKHPPFPLRRDQPTALFASCKSALHIY